jgi:hypothetical protein
VATTQPFSHRHVPKPRSRATTRMSMPRTFPDPGRCEVCASKRAASHRAWGSRPRPTRLVEGKAKRREVCQGQMSGASTPPSANLVGLGRVELPTSPLSGVRSNQLSYRPARSEDGAQSAVIPRSRGGPPHGTLPGTAQATCDGRSRSAPAL